MSNPEPSETTIKPEKKKKLLAMIEAGIDPTEIKEPADPKEPSKPTRPIVELKEEDKILNQENFDKLLTSVDQLNTHIVKKDVDANRKVILDEIKELDKEEFEVQKDNYSLNELQVSLRMARKKKPANNKRDVGATDKDGKTKQENTQWDSIKKDWVPG